MGVKYSFNQKFFDTWTEESAYLLGYLYADGSLENSPSIRGKYVRVSSTDLDRINLFKELLRSDHTIVRQQFDDNRKDKYYIRIGSTYLYNRLAELGLTPSKSLTMEWPLIPSEYLPSFTLGYFDGDGCAFIERDNKGRMRRLMAIFTSGSAQFLTKLHSELVERLGIKSAGLCPHGSTKGAYQLRYSTRDSFRVFLMLYANKRNRALAMGRKYDIFTKYLKERGLRISDLPSLLDKKGPVVKG